MFYIYEIKDFVRVAPENFGLSVRDAIMTELEKIYADYIDEDLGFVIKVLDVKDVGEGIIIPEDGAVYYDSVFSLLVFKPILNEIVYGKVEQITNFGAFINIGAALALIHISQTMDDFVNFSKSNVLLGKNTKKSLKKGDLCVARIVAISYKTIPPKIGLTMRQTSLGKLEWIEQEKKKRQTTQKEKKEEKTKEKTRKKTK